MKIPRKINLATLAAALAAFSFTGLAAQAQQDNKVAAAAPLRADGKGRIRMPEAEWRKRLPPDVYAVLRQKGTERPYTGALLKNKRAGTYLCGGCGLPLFASDTKFESGTGWPSFFKAINKTNVAEVNDSSHGMARTEVLCSRCGGHLGHVFDDGPKPTGLRYCINSAALTFEEAKK